MSSRKQARRFFSRVEVAPAEGQGFRILLDGRSLLTRGRVPLMVSGEKLAEAIAEEWRAQQEVIRPQTMPLTQIVNTVIDRTGPYRREGIEELMRFAGTDLVCYRATEPESLVRRQTEAWEPLLDWVRDRFGVRLTVTRTILPVAQPEGALSALRNVLLRYDDYRLAAVQITAGATGSLVLSLALVEGHLGAEEVFVASQLDELWQSELWGVDEVARCRRDSLRLEIAGVAGFLVLAVA
ncbi:MAG: ATP12 family chaperone protein [Alphaproteobacteria bacterium]